jgi:putative DNA primase/helicase
LFAEAPGILRWLVEGCLAWQRDGLNPPAAVQAATREYQESQDLVGEFLAERCTIQPESKADIYTPKGDLHRAYLDWARVEGDTDPLSLRAFGERIRERGIEEGRHGDSRTRIWKGIGLLAPLDRRGRDE